jgi:hypothetical protein
MRFKIMSFIFTIAMLSLSACSGNNSLGFPDKSGGGQQLLALGPVDHKFSECPIKEDLPKIHYVHDIQSYPDDKGVLMVMGNNELNIWIDGQPHPEKYKVGQTKDGSEAYQTMMYLGSCHDKSIDVKFFVGKKTGSWTLDAVPGGYQFINKFDGVVIEKNFYPKVK